MDDMREDVQEFGIGSIIRDMRMKQGITLERLSSGLCALPSLSRIESGKQQPSRALAMALLQRLGLMDEKSYLWSGLEDMALEDLKQRIKRANGRFDYETALQLLDELEGRVKANDAITRQFITWSRAINGSIQDGKVCAYSTEQQLEMTYQAIRCTVPDFNEKKIHRHLLCLDEMIMMVNISNFHAQLGERQIALNLYRQLLEYAEDRLLPLFQGGVIIPLITYNYSKHLGKAGRSEEELEIAERGIQCCVQYGKSHLIGELYINKACALHRLGRKEEGREAAILSYYVLKALEKQDNAQIVQEYLKDTYSYYID